MNNTNDLIIINISFGLIGIFLHLFNNYKINKIKNDLSAMFISSAIQNLLGANVKKNDIEKSDIK
jgi:hypothetical protein